MRISGLLVLCSVAVAHMALLVSGYPDYFLQKYTNSDYCSQHPDKAFGGHDAPQPDRETSMLLTPKFSLSEKVTKLCPGAQYTLQVTFPGGRLGLLTASMGAFAGTPDQKCPNRVITPKQSPVTNWQLDFGVPCSAAGSDIQFKQTSSDGATGALKNSIVTLAVAPTTGACNEVSAHCDGSSVTENNTYIPLSKFNADSSAGEIDGMAAGVSQLAQPPVYSLRPVLQSNSGLWQFLHALLMLVSFGVLLPLGVLLARHKWMFGSNEKGRVSSSWFFVHILVQVGGIVAGVGGFAIALLAFGWKDVPGQSLYLPHKWVGVAVLAMGLLQLLSGPLRPALQSAARPCWNLLHWSWGRLTVLGGAGNLILGALLVHDYQGQPYTVWLLTSCVVIGVMGLLALILEAFKTQMQRTYRYDPKDNTLRDVLQGYKQSSKRVGCSMNSPCTELLQMQQPMYTTAERSDHAAMAGMQYPRVQYGMGGTPVGFAADVLNHTAHDIVAAAKTMPRV